jgi:sugar-phosphatase
VITVALATAHQAGELDADLVVQDLSALSVLVTDEGTETSARG